MALIEIEAPWSMLREKRVRVLVRGVDVEVETCAWQLDDVSQVESEKRRALEEDMAQRRHNLTSSEMERAHWLSLLLTSVINKADVTVKDVRVCLHDTASKIGGSGAQGLPSTFGLQLSELLLVAGPFRV